MPHAFGPHRIAWVAKGQQANLNATLSSSLYLSFSKNSFFWCSSGCSLKADAKVGIFLTPAKNWQRNLHVFNFRLHLTGVTSSKCVRTHYNINASQTNQATHTTTLTACAVHRCAAFVETNNKQLRHQAGTNFQKTATRPSGHAPILPKQALLGLRHAAGILPADHRAKPL